MTRGVISPLALPAMMLELLREYLLKHSTEGERIRCFEDPIVTFCEIGGTVSASQLCDAHPCLGTRQEKWGKLGNRFWFSRPEGEIRTFYGSSLGGLCVQATMHT